ncbi:MAG: hypothetical protein E6Q97_16145 [Desulfurellales bacterium]|nr:MAG: hypothetical protein E6Q97_16145 [Desulfurellales bacterium]
MEIIIQEYENQERITDQEARPGRKPAQLLAIIMVLTCGMALAIPQAEAAPVLQRPQSAEVLRYFCSPTPAP